MAHLASGERFSCCPVKCPMSPNQPEHAAPTRSCRIFSRDHSQLCIDFTFKTYSYYLHCPFLSILIKGKPNFSACCNTFQIHKVLNHKRGLRVELSYLNLF